MTKQEIFDKVWQYFIVEKHKRSVATATYNNDETCFYRHPCGDGRRCIVGLFIADEHYEGRLETLLPYDGRVSEALARSGLEGVTSTSPLGDFMRSMQKAHDRSEGEYVDATLLRGVAALYELEVPS
jgi:hypothetical protein